MSKLEKILNTGVDYLNNASDELKKGADYLDTAVGELKEADRLVKNGMKVAAYWNPLDDSQRQKAKREIERLKIKGRWLIVRYIALWIAMIVITRMIYLAI